MCRFNAILLLVAACTFFSAGTDFPKTLTAQDLPTDPRPHNDGIDQLSRGSFAERQRATLEMWRVRDQSRDRVQSAAKHHDPEIAGRAQWILRQWRRGSLPGTPPEISRLLAKTSGPAGIDQLLSQGQFAAATVAVEESVGTVEYESILLRVHLSLMQRFPTYVHAAMKYQRVPELLDFIDAVAASKEDAVARVEFMQELGVDIDAQGLLPKSAETWTQTERVQAEALVLIILGRMDQAVEVAQQATDKRFLFRCRAIAGRWKDSMDDALTAAQNAEYGSAEHARLWSQTMICADRAGDSVVFQQAADQLVAADVSDNSSARDLRWRTLASHGEVESAIEMLDKFDPAASASVAIAASRSEHAFEIMEYPLDQLDDQIDVWVDAAIASQREIGERDKKLAELGKPVNNLLVLIRCLISIGREDAARSVVQRLCSSDVRIGKLGLRDHVLESLRFTSRIDWIAEFAIADGEKAPSKFIYEILAVTLPDADTNSLELVNEALSVTNRTQNAKQRIANACELMSGTVPDEVDEATYFKKLHDLAIMPGRGAGRRLASRSPAFVRPRIRANLNIVRLFLRHGQAEHANAILQKLAETGDQDAMLLLAEQELDAGSTELARVLFETLNETVFGRSNGRRFSGANRDELAVKSLIGQWTIARRHGDLRRAEGLQKEIRLSVCGPSTRLRNAIAQYLVDRNEHELAIEVFDDLLPMAVFGNEDRTRIYDVARNYASLVSDAHMSEAARWYDLAIVDVVRAGNFIPGAYISVPLYVRRWAVEAAIEQNNKPAINRHIDRIMQLNPLDIALAESILPKMRQADSALLADSTLDRIMNIGVDYCQRFPEDATTANNLAWVAAMNGQHLETALELSQQAVYREPDSAIYRDTLAEILFRLDRVDEALQIEEACLLDDATQWHLHKQVEKYRQAAGN
jgi:tetratricopeptide (TPR) repeat protein